MKKSLIAFYVKVALAIGVPVLGVAAIIAVINNEPKVNEGEVHIIETGQTSIGESETVSDEIVWQEPEPTAKELTEPATTGPASTESVTTKPAPTESVTTEPVTTKPVTTKPAPTEPVTTKPAPTGPAPTEPVTTKPAPTEPATGDEPANNYEVKYTYDLLGRLISAEYEHYILEYVYDKNGNILKINKILK